MKLFRAPETVPPDCFGNSLFLAGGIGAGAVVPDWQSALVERLSDTN